MASEPVDDLARALDATERVVAGVRDEQWGDPTPCAEWNVRELVDHVVGGNYLFASALQGEPPARTEAGDDPLTAYRDSAGVLLAAFGQPGAFERVVTVPFGTVPGSVALHLRITDLLVHGWDIARATGQAATFPDDLAERELEFSRAALADVPPGRRPFAPSAPVADDAPAIDRLAALLGRATAG